MFGGRAPKPKRQCVARKLTLVTNNRKEFPRVTAGFGIENACAATVHDRASPYRD